MKRKRIKYVANIDFGYRSITDAKQHIKIFLKSPPNADSTIPLISIKSFENIRIYLRVPFENNFFFFCISFQPQTFLLHR